MLNPRYTTPTQAPEEQIRRWLKLIGQHGFGAHDIAANIAVAAYENLKKSTPGNMREPETIFDYPERLEKLMAEMEEAVTTAKSELAAIPRYIRLIKSALNNIETTSPIGGQL